MSTGNAEIFGEPIDNRPLWDYIDDSLDFSSSGLNLPNCDIAEDRPSVISTADYPACRGRTGRLHR